jgi:hypothetical protein
VTEDAVVLAWEVPGPGSVGCVEIGDETMLVNAAKESRRGIWIVVVPNVESSQNGPAGRMETSRNRRKSERNCGGKTEKLSVHHIGGMGLRKPTLPSHKYTSAEPNKTLPNPTGANKSPANSTLWEISSPRPPCDRRRRCLASKKGIEGPNSSRPSPNVVPHQRARSQLIHPRGACTPCYTTVSGITHVPACNTGVLERA